MKINHDTLNPSPNPLPVEDPDDYMSMTITEPAQPPMKETYTQRRIRKQREVSFVLHSS